MKRYIILLVISLFACSERDTGDPEVPEEPEVTYEFPCNCDEWPFEAFYLPDELPWNFPIILGSDEWKQLQSIEERYNACQMSEEIFPSLSTTDLAAICMQYPMYFVTIVNGPYENGLDTLFKYSNGHRELFKREDVLTGLLNWYGWAIDYIPYILTDECTTYERLFLHWGIATMGLLLSRYQSTDIEDYFLIMKCLYYGYQKTLLYPEEFGNGKEGMVTNTNLYSRVKTMLKIDEQIIDQIPQKEQNQLFLKNKHDDQTRQIIDELSCEFINNH